MSPTFRSLRIRNYRLYATGALISNIGTWMQRIAQDWLVLELTDNNGIALGITTGLQFLPMLLVGPWAGSLADRYSKRQLLILTQAFMGVVGAFLGLLVITDIVKVWHVFVLAGLLGIGAAVDAPARQSFVIEMVGADDVSNAVGLNSASFNLGRVIGPALAGFLIVLFGTGPVFLINAASYIAVILALRAMRVADLQSAPRMERGKGQVREGIRYVRRRPDLMLVMVIIFFVGTFGLNFQMTSALMATEVFGKGAAEYGLLGSVLAIGSLSGALLAARRGRPRLRLVVLSAVAFGMVEIVAGLMPTYISFIALAHPDRAVPDDAAQRRERHRAARGRPDHAGPGDGALHGGADGWHAVRGAAGRLRRRDVRPTVEPHRRRPDLGRGGDHRGPAARPPRGPPGARRADPPAAAPGPRGGARRPGPAGLTATPWRPEVPAARMGP